MKKLLAGSLLLLLTALLHVMQQGYAIRPANIVAVSRLMDVHHQVIAEQSSASTYFQIDPSRIAGSWILATEEAELEFPEIDIPEETNDNESSTRHSGLQNDYSKFIARANGILTYRAACSQSGKPYRALTSRQYILHRAILI